VRYDDIISVAGLFAVLKIGMY